MTVTATIRTRPVTEEEYADIAARGVVGFAAELARADHTEVTDELREKAAGFFPADLAQAAAEHGTHILRLLDADGTAVGLLWLGRHSENADTGFVYDVEIDEAHRGRGLGRAAMLEAEKVLAADGCTRIALNVFGWNESAAGLYRSLGYQVDSTHMSKPLTSDGQDPH